MSTTPLLGERDFDYDTYGFDDTYDPTSFYRDTDALDDPIFSQTHSPVLLPLIKASSSSSSSDEGSLYDPSMDEDKKIQPIQPLVTIQPNPPKRKRGRPKGTKNKKQIPTPSDDRINAVAFAAANPPGVPNPYLHVNQPTGVAFSSQETAEKPLKKAKIAHDPNVFRSIAVYPAYLMDPKVVHCLDFHNEGTPEIRQAILNSAESKLNQVLSGSYVFGERVLIKSFVPYRPPLTMVASPPNLFLWHVLMGHGVMTTRHGMVSVFPVTVYNSEKNLQSQQQGFPCLAVHVAHMKTLLWRMFSCCRNIPISNESLSNQCHYQLEFDPADDGPLIALSGFDAYHVEAHKQQGGFMLFSAEYVDIMKHFFVTQDMCLRDIGTILSQVYRHIPELKGKFSEEFRPLWLGEERQANVVYMLGKDDKDHAFGMARARSLSGQVRFGGGGKKWTVCDSPINKPSNYHVNSFAYGVQCWSYQLALLNSAYTYFTGQALSEWRHQLGLLELDPNTQVQDREKCIKIGLLNDYVKYVTSPVLRRARGKLESTYGTEFVRNFFGAKHVKVYQKRK